MLKPRSHVKIGGHRGHVVASPSELRLGFRPFPVEPSPYDVNLALPLLQHYVPPDAASVVSVTGFIDESGRALAVDHCEKLRQWPPRLGIGCLFRAVPPQPFTERARWMRSNRSSVTAPSSWRSWWTGAQARHGRSI